MPKLRALSLRLHLEAVAVVLRVAAEQRSPPPLGFQKRK